MGRRNEHSREELRQMVLDAAVELIEEGGVENLSARKIAKRIGYAVGSLYVIFDNVSDIIQHINADTLEVLNRNVKILQEDQALAGEQLLQQLAYFYLNFSVESHARWSLLYEYKFPPEIGIPDWYQAKIDVLFTTVEELLACVFNDSKVDIGNGARVLWAGLHGICMLSFTGKLDVAGIESAKRLTDFYLITFYQGMKSNSK